MRAQDQYIVKPVYKLTRFEAFKELDRLSKQFPLLDNIVDRDKNIQRREELIKALKV